MAKSYDHKAIEKKWQERWARERLYETPDVVKGKENFYTLFELPYPSGDLHVGHWYAYTAPDAYARMMRMNGKNVLFPIGFDAFGLPAENAAIKNKADPKKWTLDNISRMRDQLKTMGTTVDWSREVSACDPAYYKWTQWLFLKLYENGLAYRGKAVVNWDPVDKTVLANEQVLPDGTAERSGAVVEKKELEQWFFKITDYADRLLEDLEPLNWPESIKEAQRNWIGKSEGAEIDFPITDPDVSKVVILHGRGSNSETAFIPWLKKSLEARGYSVEAPTMPGSENPNDLVQAEFIEKNIKLGPRTAIVGHSFGGVVALRLLERGAKVARVTLIGTPYSGRFIDEKKRDSVGRALSKGFDVETIKKNSRNFTFLYGTNDRIIPIEDGESYLKMLGGTLVKAVGSKSHFMDTIEPAVLASCAPSVRVFTTRPDTIFGATYLVLAPEHPLVAQFTADRSQWVVNNKHEVKKYVEASKRKSELERQKQEKEKTGVRIEGIEAVNPATKEKIPVYVADFVLGGYGTGALMAVPAHDERDHEFAKRFGLPIHEVIEAGTAFHGAYTGDGILKDSGEFSGKHSAESRMAITLKVGGFAKRNYKLRDWLVSRQRYWGAPIPIVYDPEGKPHPIPEKHLPWLLPEDVDHTPTGVPPLARSKELVDRTEKIFGDGWRPDPDTLDTFVDSSWYFLRYLDPKNDHEFCSLESQKKWMPIKRYSGGSEHTTVHVLYSRFLYKALHDLKLVTHPEPYLERLNRGLVLAEDGRKMSKRWGNVVNPDEQVQNVGADAVRTYLAFIGPYNVVGSFPWSTNGLIGVRRFLERAYGMAEKVSDVAPLRDTEHLMHESIRKVEEEIGSMKMNTAVSQLMIFSNELLKLPQIPRTAFETFLKLLAPFAPHLADELWEPLGHDGSIHGEAWPAYDAQKIERTTVTVAVQIGGKTKGTVIVPRGSSEEEVLDAMRGDKKLSILAVKSAKRTIFVPDKVINIVP